MSIGSKKSAALSYMAPPKTDDATRLESYIPLYRVWEGFCANLPLVLGFFVRSGLVALALRFRSKRETRDLFVPAQAHHDHALRRPAEALDLGDRHPNHRAAGRHQHQLRELVHGARPRKLAARLGELDGLHTEPAAALDRVVGHPGPLAEALVGDDEDVVVLLRDGGRDDLVALAEAHALHARGRAAHRPNLGLVEADRLALARDEHDVVRPARVEHVDKRVVLAQLDRDDPVRLQRRVVVLELRLLDDPLLRREDEVLRLLVISRRDHRAYLLALGERQQVDDRAALRLARPERQLVNLEAVDLPDRREEEQVVVRRGDEQGLDVVLVLEVHAHDADPAAALLAVGADG